MADRFMQVYIHVVFATKGRQSFIHPSWENKLYKYITGIVQTKGQKMLAINGMPDHLHFLIDYRGDILLSDLVREVKKSSNKFVNENGFTPHRFGWQAGYGAFSHSTGSKSRVIQYIMNQKAHHRKRSFREEYIDLLNKFDIPYQEEYLFEWA